jgi:thermostable 8-oxoguanine DNA glycosylase
MKLTYTKRALNIGLECYDPEHRVFPNIAEKVKQRGCLNERDILLILKWKLGRIKDSNLKTIRKVDKVNKAILVAPSDAKKALGMLQNIPGIGLATATAILTVCLPDCFTIIDKRVLTLLGLRPFETESWTTAKYIEEFLPRVRECSKKWGCTLRDADRALWGLSVQHRIEDILASAKRRKRKK